MGTIGQPRVVVLTLTTADSITITTSGIVAGIDDTLQTVRSLFLPLTQR
jgi:hypothetical protein